MYKIEIVQNNSSQECGQTREMLASLRDLVSIHIAQGNLDEALKLLAIVLNHRASDQNSLNHPERWEERFQGSMGRPSVAEPAKVSR